MADMESDSQNTAPEATSDDGAAPAATSDDGAAPAATSGDGAAPAATSGDGAAPAATSDDGAAPAATSSEGFTLASERSVTPARTDMTVAEMREWLRNWIANATGQSADAIDESAAMVELGLSSRDAVAMASDIEDLTGVTLTATVAFRHPTIESLATVIVEGEPELADGSDLDEDWSRDVDEDVANIAIVGIA